MNNAFRFTSSVAIANEVIGSSRNGVYVFNVDGALYHVRSMKLNQANDHLLFAQLYSQNANESVEHRMRLVNSSEIDDDL